VIDIVYVTMAALAYLFLFRFIDVADMPRRGRLALLGLGVSLGLCLGSKLYIPAVTWLLAVGSLIYIELRGAFGSSGSRRIDPIRARQTVGAVMLVGAISAAFYLVVFLPHYILGWWGGIGDLFKYYSDVIWYENSVESATHPYSSPWWSWPLLLRPVAYWQAFPKTGPVATVWGAGNPVLWWGGLTAIAVTLTRAIERPRFVTLFLVTGYVAYLGIWIPIGRTIFLYHYMPAIYLAYLALGLLLAECWEGRAQMWEQLALMLTLAPPLILGLGAAAGAIGFLLMAVVYAAMLDRPLWAGRLVCAAFVLAVLTAFAYFYPVWIGIPISREAYYARMWFQGPGLRNWI
jgi:dolichyl-phosphate-mannose--protein O-mannosyl transferase